MVKQVVAPGDADVRQRLSAQSDRRRSSAHEFQLRLYGGLVQELAQLGIRLARLALADT